MSTSPELTSVGGVCDPVLLLHEFKDIAKVAKETQAWRQDSSALTYYIDALPGVDYGQALRALTALGRAMAWPGDVTEGLRASSGELNGSLFAVS